MGSKFYFFEVDSGRGIGPVIRPEEDLSGPTTGSMVYELDCGGEKVLVERDGEELIFHGWDQDAELAAIELGFEPSVCYHVAKVMAADYIRETTVYKQKYELFDSLNEAVAEGNEVIAGMLISLGVAERGEDSLFLVAIMYPGRLDIAKMLLDAGADVHTEDEQALVEAAREYDHETIDFLLRHGADLKKALRRMEEARQYDAVEVLLAHLEDSSDG
jgi:hypothetical protein